MREKLRLEIKEWVTEEFKLGRLRMGSIGTITQFMGRVDKHRQEGLHWFDRIDGDLARCDCWDAQKTFRERFGVRVLGSLIRDTKNVRRELWEVPGNKEGYTSRDFSRYTRTIRSENKIELKRAQLLGRFTEKPLVEIEPLKGKLVSVEVEYYGKRKKDDKFGRTGNDGSLNDRDGGSEYKLTTWTPETAVRKLRDLKEIGILFGGSCGLHVHVDLRDYSQQIAEDTWNVLQTRFGPAVQKLVPVSRHNLHYCNFANRDANQRYSAWNIYCFQKYGTLEWRMQGPMVRSDWRADTRWEERVATWMRVCQSITRKLAAERAAHLAFPCIPEGSRPVSWKRFLELLPSDLAEWCEIRAEMLEKGESKKNEKSCAHIGDACGPLPCMKSRNFTLNKTLLGGWSPLINESLARTILQECECKQCQADRQTVIETIVGYGELSREGIDSTITPAAFRAMCEARLATLPPGIPDSERVLECINAYASQGYVPSWLFRRIQSKLPASWSDSLRFIRKVALINDCLCDSCETSRIGAWQDLALSGYLNTYTPEHPVIATGMSAPAKAVFEREYKRQQERIEAEKARREKLLLELQKRADYKARVRAIKPPNEIYYKVSAEAWQKYYDQCEAWLAENPNLPAAAVIHDNAIPVSQATARAADLAMEAHYMETSGTSDDELDPDEPEASDDTWLSDEVLSPIDLETIAEQSAANQTPTP